MMDAVCDAATAKLEPPHHILQMLFRLLKRWGYGIAFEYEFADREPEKSLKVERAPTQTLTVVFSDGLSRKCLNLKGKPVLFSKALVGCCFFFIKPIIIRI